MTDTERAARGASSGAPGRRREPVDPDDLAELFAAYRATGDRRLRNRIVERHYDVARFHARRFRGRGVPQEDLEQIALLCMVRAVDRFDPSVGVPFATFAGRNVEGELKRHFRDRTWNVRPPRRAQELFLEVRAAEEVLRQRLRRAPTPAEIAREVEADLDRVLEAIAAGDAYRATSLDQGDEVGTPLSARLGAVDGHYSELDWHLTLEKVMCRLSERDQEIVRLRFFDELSQSEVAARIGVSQSYLSRMIARILGDLEARLGAAVHDR